MSLYVILNSSNNITSLHVQHHWFNIIYTTCIVLSQTTIYFLIQNTYKFDFKIIDFFKNKILNLLSQTHLSYPSLHFQKYHFPQSSLPSNIWLFSYLLFQIYNLNHHIFTWMKTIYYIFFSDCQSWNFPS